MGKWKAVRLNLSKDRDAPIELYNLNKDPSEAKNIAARHEKIVNKIRPLFESARVPSDLFKLFPEKG